METKKKSTMTAALIGGIAVLVIMVVGTFWMGQAAKQDTDKAVRAVSLLYLDELAGRREQVVAVNDERTPIRGLNACQNGQQGRFATAVAAQNTRAGTRLQFQINALQNRP